MNFVLKAGDIFVSFKAEGGTDSLSFGKAPKS